MRQRTDMRSTLRPWHFGIVLASLSLFGCKSQVDIPDPGCTEPKPEVPAGTWCPPAYVCVDGDWVDTGGACPDPECPQAKPASGSACDLVGQVCDYEEDVPCGELEQVSALCTATGWEVMANYCQPEAECPDELPIVGADCTGWDLAYACFYNIETACGEQGAFVNCEYTPEGSVWTMASGPTCQICKDYGTEAECSVTASCQWLTAGCGDEPIQTGCYPKEGCDVSDCNDDSICVEVSYDPCYGESCDACGAPYFACLPSWAP